MYRFIDIALIAIIAIAAYKGYRAGLINSVVGIIAVVVAIYGANLVATTFSGEFTGLLEPFISGFVESIENRIVDYVPSTDDREGDFVPVEVLEDGESRSTYRVSYSVLRQIGFSDGVADSLASEVADKIDTVGARMNTELTDVLCKRLSFIAVFVISFFLIFIIFTAIGNLLDVAFGLPGLEAVNHILGGILGAAKGIVIVVVIACIARYLGFILKSDVVEKTWVLKRLMESNILASILDI